MNQKKKKSLKADLEKEVSRILAEARREPRFQAQRERNALIEAIEYGHEDIAHSLLAHGVDPNSTRPNGRSALWYAAHWGRSDLIRDLVTRGARLSDDVLMGPVHDGDVDIVRFLVGRGANVNCIATFTRHSYKFPQKEVLLTEAIRSISLMTIAQSAARELGALMPPKKGSTCKPGSRNDNLESIPIMLIKAGAKVNRLAFEVPIFEGFNRTILGLAAHCGFAQTVKAMLAAGADVNQKDTWGGTALFDAAHEGHRRVAKILLAAGARVDIKRFDGATPISIARGRGYTQLAKEIENYAMRVKG